MKAKINLPNIKGYLQAHYREILKDFDFLPKHIQEQAEWRLKQVAKKSPECLENDSCKICTCQVTSKVFEDRACEGNCYPQMMSKEQWEIYKTLPEVITNPFAPIIIIPESANMANLLQANPNLTKEELLYWCPEFKDEHPHLTNNELSELNSEYTVRYDNPPGISGTKFKVKLSKDQFSGNMTPEQIEDIAKDLGFYDSGNTEPIQIKDADVIIMDLSKDETLEELMRDNPHLSKEDILKLVPDCCPICKGIQVTNDGYPCYFCKPEEYKQQTD